MRFLIILALFFSASSFANSERVLLQAEQAQIKIYQDAVPSVVNVANTRLVRDMFFGGISEQETGAGTGFVWDADGHIVTNFHVVQDPDAKFKISFLNSDKQVEQIEAKIVGVEPKLDVAVLKVDKLPKGVKPIQIGTSKDLQVGQMTIAIGNPFELDYTMTSGIISALGRKIQGIGGVEIHDMIQTDAAINPGNSGGPLLDSQGQLIGMNTLIYSRTGASNGLGFAVPIDSISRVVPDLIKHGKVIQPALGIAILPDHYRRYLGENMSERKGVIVADAKKGSPAERAGIKGMMRDRRGRIHMGDTILSINDSEVNDYNDIYHVLKKHKIGEEVTVLLETGDGKKKKVKIKLTAL